MPVFLFTDIEGSSQLWEKHGRDMAEALSRHGAILHGCIMQHGGKIIKHRKSATYYFYPNGRFSHPGGAPTRRGPDASGPLRFDRISGCPQGTGFSRSSFLMVDQGHTGDGAFALFDGGDPLQCALAVQKRLAAEQWGAIGELRICELVEGLPLGIELAAAWVRVLSCEEIAQEIQQNISFLEGFEKKVPERHRSLWAVFEHSWKLLSDKEREVFRRMSVFSGGFRREAGDKVAAASPRLLLSLVDKCLLRRNPAGRYEMLATLLARRGDVGRALPLLDVVLSYPATEQEAKDRAERLRAELAPAALPGSGPEAGVGLEEVVAQVLGHPRPAPGAANT